MSVSIIIPTLNAEKTLDSLLLALRSQHSIFEIIIIDSSSTDNTLMTAKKYGAKIISIPRNSFNHGRTRNLAAIASKGDILVFMTQDAIPQNNYLIKNLISPLNNPEIAASSGTMSLK
jgi:rhamnosyltransferase